MSRRVLDRGLALPLYDQCLKASHLFNLLDARRSTMNPTTNGLHPARRGPSPRAAVKPGWPAGTWRWLDEVVLLAFRAPPRSDSCCASLCALPAKAGIHGRGSPGPSAEESDPPGAACCGGVLHHPVDEKLDGSIKTARRGELLLELLSEEIPARMQRRAIRGFATGLLRDKLAAADLPSETARGYATPRRLAIIAEGIPPAQPDRSEERRGPRLGASPQAIEGFLRSAGLDSIDQCEIRDSEGRGAFHFAVVRRPGRPAARCCPS